MVRGQRPHSGAAGISKGDTKKSEGAAYDEPAPSLGGYLPQPGL